MTTVDDAKWHKQAAEQAVKRFVPRFDESYLRLAYHAALPLVLTPELVNYLRNEFLRGECVPWVAEVDLLLSDLCSQVGYELYAMDTHVRGYLLQGMKKRYGERRMQEVAQVLISYVSYLSRINPGRRQPELEAQRWAAMVYLGDDSCKQAAQEIAERLETIGKRDSGFTESGIRAELARLARITEELSPQLQEEQSLLDYAKLVQQLLRKPDEVEPADVQQFFQVGDVELILPDRLLPDRLIRNSGKRRVIEGFPPIQTFEFEEASISIEFDSIESELDTTSNLGLQPFEFEVATIEINEAEAINTESLIEAVDEAALSARDKHLNRAEKLLIEGVFAELPYKEIAEVNSYSVGYIRRLATSLWEALSEVFDEKVTKNNLKEVIKPFAVHKQLTIKRLRQQAWGYSEDLGNDVQLEMVAIPEGSFMMGSPEDESERSKDESPQHQITVKSFFMGKYLITQAQWKAVATWPQINRELHPDPSKFKGANRPVETVSWLDAVEFCHRLSKHTGKSYRLPSEAEWEYTCRAGTTTPFHFGETITTNLANYNGNFTYGAVLKGINREETTPVGSFGVTNNFGLYDMHGNVWEWCADTWHFNYKGAPNDGSAWLDEEEKENYNHSYRRVLRGGSWFFDPVSCRSAYRRSALESIGNVNYGFRVVCSSAWTL